MAIKLDRSEAYDKVKFDFLAYIMTKMGFPSSWISRVMFCVSLVTYSSLVYGEFSNIVVPKRGLC